MHPTKCQEFAAGSDTHLAMNTLRSARLAACKSRAVVIGLAPANQGLRRATTLHEAETVASNFLSGLRELVDLVKQRGSVVFLGGVYPNGAYSPQLHAEVLHDVHETMQTWGLPLFNFLSVTENPLAMGQWLPGISADAGHPNTQGHTLMYNAIDISLFANLQCPLI
uniref:SGNH hydrolase-type esterase domain-containing protein n=1 Tax=Calcidiscus leptoporus TaxID=127549 RepID=A0A7S0NVK0_9EUKA|mmetsp:Transcript_30928/g.71868  ORF Transcript_30928/g.71868 Transcript_30928/m.71868 type:complete len:167 (+) Transcript_30928:145-645(+)